MDKYKASAEATIKSVDWEEIKPASPFYLFLPQDHDAWQKYDKGWKVTDVFPVNSVGIVTARDKLAIQFDKKSMLEIAQDFAGLAVEEAREKYRLGKDARDWKVHFAQADLNDTDLDDRRIAPVSYRPFDTRFTYYTGKSRGFVCRPRGNVMQHMLRDNVGLSTTRQVKTGDTWQHVSVTDAITESTLISNRTSEIGYLFPLWLYPLDDAPRVENLRA